MNKPSTDQEWGHWLAEEVRGFSVHARHAAFYIDGEPSSLMNYENKNFMMIRDWNPLAKENLWQMFECVEKSKIHLVIVHVASLLMKWAISAYDKAGDEGKQIAASGGNDLNKAIAEALFKAINNE